MRELVKNMKDMNAKTSVDPVGLSNKILKMGKGSEIIRENLLILFNRCLVEQKIPQKWKNSVITMLLETG